MKTLRNTIVVMACLMSSSLWAQQAQSALFQPKAAAQFLTPAAAKCDVSACLRGTRESTGLYRFFRCRIGLPVSATEIAAGDVHFPGKQRSRNEACRLRYLGAHNVPHVM